MNRVHMYYLVALLILISCKKENPQPTSELEPFIHQNLDVGECELCPFADNIPGVFRGLITGADIYNAGAHYGDSVTAYIERLYLGDTEYEDSNIMYFKSTLTFDTLSLNPLLYIDTLEVWDMDGTVGDQTNWYPRYIFLSQDSIGILNQNTDNSGNLITWIQGTMYRQ